ncbi:hypothetical protein APR11_001656 [Nocardia amikacinitolerans]|uniref:hypothetical protein n=1 Tax=Nocardia amikacinitolerans TaxID=756689 RepID=UPI0020A5F3AC|nr:hypothetical protein [Nocardia amikacinitolerans]MCP2295249.1 hypothetical protein [Nocardia amikacinitolerans]
MSENALKWSQLASQARAGELYLDDQNAALLCAKACDQRLADLDDLRSLANNAKNVSGFGDFNMGNELVQKFLKQATGEDHSIDKVIDEHIETVQNMREVMAISFKRITGQDVENAAPITNATEQVG